MKIFDKVETWHGLNVLIYGPSYVNDETVIGEGTQIGAFCDISRDVRIGKDCRVQTMVNLPVGTRIGDNVFIGPQAAFANDKYPPSDKLEPPILEDNVVVGLNASVGAGVTIGKNSVLVMGAVATKDVPPDAVYLGVPAEYYCSREEYDKKRVPCLSCSNFIEFSTCTPCVKEVKR